MSTKFETQTALDGQSLVIAMGQRIHCILYGGKDGIVVAIHGKQSPQTVRSFGGGVGVTGGTADLDIIWSNGSQSRLIPEALARNSVQWRIYPEVASAEDIAAAWTQVAVYKADASAKADAAKLAYQRAFEKALTDYPSLTRIPEGEHGGGQFAAKNIRKELKAAWPKVKFSVKSDYDSVGVNWTDGPTQHQVEQLVGKYKDGGFDSMQDIETFDPTAFTNLFGGARYFSYSRSVSDELLAKALNALYQRLPANLSGVDRPTVQDINFGRTERIPSLDRITVGEATRSIASAWDDVSQSYQVQTRYYELRWVTFDSEEKPQCNPLL